MQMQIVRHKRGTEVIHVETRLGIVNIYLDLHDSRGRRVESVAINPNAYKGSRKVVVRGNRMVELFKLY